MKKRIWIMMICIGGVFVTSSCTSGTSGKATVAADSIQGTTTESVMSIEETTAATETAVTEKDLQDELLAEYAREKYIRECESIGYKDLMRHEEAYIGKKIHIGAQIVQTMDGGYRCLSDSNDEYYINDIREYDTTKILVDDTVVIWGEYAGVKKMTRAINNVEEEVPEIDARYIDIQDESITSSENTVKQESTEVIGSSMDSRTKDTSEMILPDSSTRKLTDADVAGVTQKNLRIAINEIYARHGRLFKDAELQAWFKGKSWYNGTTPADKFDESSFSQIEKDNIKFLQQKKDSKSSSSTKKALSGRYATQFGNDGGAELEIVYGSGDDIYSVGFSGSWLDSSGDTSGYLEANANGAEGDWYYYADDTYGMDGAAMQIKYDGYDSIKVTSLTSRNFGGMNFPGFEGTYYRTAEYPMP